MLGLLRQRKYKVNGQRVQLNVQPSPEKQTPRRKRLPPVESVIRSIPPPPTNMEAPPTIHIPKQEATIKTIDNQPPILQPPVQETSLSSLSDTSPHSITRLRGYYMEETNRRYDVRTAWKEKGEEVEEIIESYSENQRKARRRHSKRKSAEAVPRRPKASTQQHRNGRSTRRATETRTESLPPPLACEQHNTHRRDKRRKRKRPPETAPPPLSPSSTSPSPKAGEPSKRHRGAAV